MALFSKVGFDSNALRDLSVGLCRADYVLYKQTLHALACVSGNDFCAGADVTMSVLIHTRVSGMRN